MPTNPQKLELTWIGKDSRPRLEPRILIEDPGKTYHAKHKVSKNDIFDNKLIFGDNLLALKALESEYTGKVKCIYIDPPYNTGSAFEHYDDGVEHSLWLSLIRERLDVLWKLLNHDGSIWISIDDSEVHYLKVLCDEMFGRSSFLSTIVWEQRTTRENRRTFSNNQEYILVYAKDPSKFAESRNSLDLSGEVKERYKNPDNDPRGSWQSISVNAQAGHGTKSQFYTLIAPNGKKHELPAGRCWLYTEQKMEEEVLKGNIWFGKDGNSAPRYKKFLTDVSEGLTPQTLWTAEEVGTNDHAKKNLIRLFPEEKVFDTPKPESLIQRIIHIATNPGDLILDSFAGSGTTGAVAHKMGRRWIMIELGEHCHTHIIPRLKKVIDGEDSGGITESVNWKGGGGFRYYRLAPSLLEKDKWGNWVINKEYNAAQLSEALCKLEGFTYAPSEDIYWQQGHSTETDYIYVTTQMLVHEQLVSLSEEVGESRTLLVMCSAFKGRADEFPNLTLKKIPNTVLSKCEWGHDDYSLQVQNLTTAPLKNGDQAALFGEDE